MSDFVKSKNRLSLSPGASLRIAREMMGWSQNTLSEKSGIPQLTISDIEANRITLGVEKANKLAISIQIHPSVLFSMGNLKIRGSVRQVEDTTK